MTKPVHKHLVEQRWREEGGLDLLVSTAETFQVFAQLISNLRWSVYIRCTLYQMSSGPSTPP
jgi:large subunit ribosomal protein L35